MSRTLSCVRWWWPLLPAGLVVVALLVGLLRSLPPPPASAPDPVVTVATLEPEIPLAAELAWRFDYDDVGRPTRVVNPAGQATTLRYEPDGQVIRESPDGMVMFDHRGGRRVAMTDGAGRVTYDYDGLGRPTAMRRASTPTLTFTYDSLDRPKTLAVGAEYAATYTYDYLGRPAMIDSPAGRVVYEYNEKDRTTRRTLPNGVRTTWTHTPAGRVERIEHATAAGGRIAALAYEYRPDGLIRAVTESSPAGDVRTTYDYDAAGQLLAATDSRGRRWAYTYDRLGNRLTVTADGWSSTSAFDWAGRALQIDGERCGHDPAGNLTRYAGPHGRAALEYSAAGQLVAGSNDAGRVRLAYNGDGYLIGREVGGRATTFLPDPRADAWRPLLATGPDGSRTAYLWDGDAPLAARVNGEWRFYLHDHLDSVRVVVNAGGAVVERPEYCPFGRPVRDQAAFGPGFAGHFYDPALGLYLTRARAYDPALSRFLQIDPQHRVPTGSPKDGIAYAYCGNDPVNFVDPNGCEPQPYSSSRASDDWFRTFADAARERERFASGVQAQPHGLLYRLFGALPGRIHGPPLNEMRIAYVAGYAAANAHRLQPDPLNQLQSRLPWQQVVSQESRLSSMMATQNALSGIRATQWQRPSTQLSNFINQIARGHQDQWRHGVGAASYRGPAPSTIRIPNPAPAPIPNTGANPARLAGPQAKFTPQQQATEATRRSFPPPPPPGGGSAMVPSPVGGVALAGGGHALAELGRLDGVALDAAGRLVLLSRDKAATALPPLQLEDIVTIFRCVYDHGDAPSVSIDPDPRHPNGATMNIRHGPGTSNTYVGWILFESDRLLKTYSLGKDNVTGQPFRSRIAGYDKYLDVLFPANPDRPSKQTWERFWIVPDDTAHHVASDGRTMLLQAPLKVRTEAMELRDGKLVPAPTGQSSNSADFFRMWFTDNYAKIANESRSRFPKDSGRTGEVAVFHELQRIAVISAVAERLRDQGVPMPGWMRDYPVQPVPFADTTPATTVEWQRADGFQPVKYSVYGGVTLTTPAKAVRRSSRTRRPGSATAFARPWPPPRN